MNRPTDSQPDLADHDRQGGRAGEDARRELTGYDASGREPHAGEGGPGALIPRPASTSDADQESPAVQGAGQADATADADVPGRAAGGMGTGMGSPGSRPDSLPGASDYDAPASREVYRSGEPTSAALPAARGQESLTDHDLPANGASGAGSQANSRTQGRAGAQGGSGGQVTISVLFEIFEELQPYRDAFFLRGRAPRPGTVNFRLEARGLPHATWGEIVEAYEAWRAET